MTEQPLRIDKWLWAARFYKSRSLAREAVSAGQVHLNGARVKPSRAIKIGDQLEISKGVERFGITVQLLSDRRGPAPVARTLYIEDAQSVARREREAQERKLTRSTSAAPSRRPDKKGRRLIRQFKDRE